MTANGAASTGVYPQEDEEGNPVGSGSWDLAPIFNALPSSSLNMAIVPIEIIRQYPYKKCPSGHQLGSYREE